MVVYKVNVYYIKIKKEEIEWRRKKIFFLFRIRFLFLGKCDKEEGEYGF